MVDPGELDALDNSLMELDTDPLDNRLISLRDSIDVLGLGSWSELDPVFKSAGIKVEKTRRGKGVDRQSLRDIADHVVYPKELRAATGRAANHWFKLFDELSVRQLHGGWDRRVVEQLGYISAFAGSIAARHDDVIRHRMVALANRSNQIGAAPEQQEEQRRRWRPRGPSASTRPTQPDRAALLGYSPE